jgi:AAA domain
MRTLYDPEIEMLDGDLTRAEIVETLLLRATVQASQCVPPDSSYFRIAASDLLRDGLPDLASASGQAFYCDMIADADLVVVDSLSTICRSLKENDADSWVPVQSWALSLRRTGKSVLFVHHAGKAGAQRGTSRKEDVLDTVMVLRRPPDYLPEQGVLDDRRSRAHREPLHKLCLCAENQEIESAAQL